MTPVLYFSSGSHYSRKVRMLQQELDLPLELEEVAFGPQGFGDAAFRKLNPNGKVPVLRDGDFVLWESNAIMWYLAETNGWSALWPSDVQERATIAKWQLWQAAHFSPAVDGLIWERGFKKMMTGQEANPAAVASYEQQFERWAAVLENQLSATDYLACDRFTCADIGTSTALMYAEAARIDLAKYPHLHAWFQRVTSRASWQNTAPPLAGLGMG